MKIRKAMVWIGTVISLTVMAGCGDSASLNEQSVQEQDTEHEEGNTNKVSGQEEESSIKSEDDSKQALSNDPDDDTQKETEVLTGSVKSIGAESIVPGKDLFLIWKKGHLLLFPVMKKRADSRRKRF